MENEDKRAQYANEDDDIEVPTHDENGVEYSKNQIKKMKKDIKKQREKAVKDAEKAARLAAERVNQPQKAQKKRLIDEEELDEGHYHSNRCKIINKLNEDKSSEYTPFPHKWHITHYVAKFIAEFESKMTEKAVFDLNTEVSTAGRIYEIRELSAGLIFYDIRSEGSKVQVMFNMREYKNDADYEQIAVTLKRGDICGVRGHPGRTKAGELTIQASKVKLLSPCLHMLPKASKPGENPLTDSDTRYRQRYLDLMVNNGIREKFILRSKIISYIRNFMNSRDFMEVETPTLNMLAGGATARPFITHHNYLNKELFMRVAPELFLKQLIIGGYDKVYEIGKNFRNEGMDKTHNPEFTMMEFYWAYADYQDLMDFAEELLSTMVLDLTGGTVVTVHDEEGKEIKVDFKRPWKRISMMEELYKCFGEECPHDLESDEARAFFEAQAVKHNVECTAPRTTSRLIDKLTDHFIEGTMVSPTFLIEQPQLMCPLAKYHRSKPGLTERFELFINKKEFANAYTELNDPFTQRRLFEGQMEEKAAGNDEAMPVDEGFIKAMEHGLPPTGGFGLGIDRLCMLLTDSISIGEVILFPAMKPIEQVHADRKRKEEQEKAHAETDK